MPGRRLFLAALTLSLLGTPQAAALVTTDRDDDEALRLVTSQLPPMLPGQSGWVSLVWSATSDVCDVEVTARARGLGVDYPANTRRHSSFYTNDALAASNLDFTAFKLTAPERASDAVEVTFVVTYRVFEDDDEIEKSDDLARTDYDCEGSRGRATTTATLPVQVATGDPVTLVTRTATVTAGKPGWVPLTFRGTVPGLDKFRVTVTPPKGASVTYPNEDSSSGLATDATLPVAGEDYAAVRIDPGDLARGRYDLPVQADWRGGSFRDTLTLVVD